LSPSVEPTFFFMHVMKTGGATFMRHVEANFGPQEVYPEQVHPGPPRGIKRQRAYVSVDQLRSLPVERRRVIRMYVGHFPFVASSLIEPAPVTMTLLREPVERTVSVLRHCKRHNREHRELPLEAIYEDPWIQPMMIRDHQAKLFGITLDDAPESLFDVIEVDSERLEIAKRNLERLDVLGLSERFDDFLDQLARRFGWRVDPVPSLGVSIEGWDVSPSFRRRIAADNAVEVAFYEHAKTMYERRLRTTLSAMPAAPQAATRAPQRARLDAIDFAVEQLGVKSFADLEIAEPYGQYAFYAIDKPGIDRGVLVDVRGTYRRRDQLLTTIEEAAERPGLRLLDGDAFDPRILAEIGPVDAVFLFDVLLHMVAPDWDRVLALYAPSTSCFVIANPQWEGGDATVRLIDLGRDRFLEAVPPSRSNVELFDRIDDWHAPQGRLYRDAMHVWQWGITDADLIAKMDALGFRLENDRRLGRPGGAAEFVRKTFVFARPELARSAGNEGEASDLRHRLAVAERERDQWRARHDDVDRTLQEVLGSRSWRLTEPLRALRRQVRRRR
jgi:hypothetical protein